MSLFPAFLQNYCLFHNFTTIFLTPFLRSPLNNTVAKTFSSLLFQIPYHFTFNLETLETIDLTFPNSSYHTISLIHEPLPLKLKLQTFPPETFQKLYSNFHHNFSSQICFSQGLQFFALPMSVSSHSY